MSASDPGASTMGPHAAPNPGPAEPSAATDPSPSVPPSEVRPLRWGKNLMLFAATVVSVFFAGEAYVGTLPQFSGLSGFVRALPHVIAALPTGWTFAVPLLAILLTHEFGHFVAARVHNVDASLPFFIPLPISPFGTMGAVISMRERIRSRDALLDIGASGPLAGLCVAIPVLVIGLMHSHVNPNDAHGVQEGQCLLYSALKRMVLGPIPDGYDVFLHPTAFAGWAGLLVTMMNLVAVGQLDGGHIAYALFGPRQNRYARVLHNLLLVIAFYNFVHFARPVIATRHWEELAGAASNSSFWLVWYVLISVIMRAGGRDHPPTEPGELHPVRKGLAVLSLALFVLLFMPTPYSSY